MKTLFCYGSKMDADINGNYYSETFNEEILNRYFAIGEELYHFENISIIDNDKIIEIIDSEEKLKHFKAKPQNGMMSIGGFSNKHGTARIIPCHNFMTIKGLVYENSAFKKQLIKKMEEFDFIIIRLPNVLGNIAIDVAKKLKKPYLIEVVGCPWDAFWNHSFKGKFVAPFMYYATKKRVRDAGYVVYVTNEFLQKKYPTNGKSTSCSNVALPEFDDKVLEKRLIKIQSMQNEDKIVLGTTAAVDVRYKGQQYVIKALSNLKNQGITNFKYQIVGGGDQTYLKSVAEKYGVKEQVEFLGSVSHNKIFDWLETIDIYIQPSRQEGLPRALIEAMSRGVPAFGARTGGIPELIEDKYIFSNTQSNIHEICTILKKFDKDTMINQAKLNYVESKKYNSKTIEERRKMFFKEFKNSASEI